METNCAAINWRIFMNSGSLSPLTYESYFTEMFVFMKKLAVDFSLYSQNNLWTDFLVVSPIDPLEISVSSMLWKLLKILKLHKENVLEISKYHIPFQNVTPKKRAEHRIIRFNLFDVVGLSPPSKCHLKKQTFGSRIKVNPG